MDQDEHLETWCFLLGLFFKALCIQHGGKAPKRKQRKRKLYFPKCMCDEAPRLNRTSTWGTLWKCHPFNLEKPLFFLLAVSHCVLQQLGFQRVRGSHSFRSSSIIHTSSVCLVCVCRDSRAAMNYSPVVGFLPHEGKSRPASSSSFGAISESQHAATGHKLFIFMTLRKVRGGSRILVSTSPSLIPALQRRRALTPTAPT